MNGSLAGHPRLERLLGSVLRYGTWFAAAVISIGMALSLADWPSASGPMTLISGTNIITVGVGVLILLPTLRVALMLMVFVQERDYRFAAITALVLAIILLGLVLAI